jgi:hypothetical protein
VIAAEMGETEANRKSPNHLQNLTTTFKWDLSWLPTRDVGKTSPGSRPGLCDCWTSASFSSEKTSGGSKRVRRTNGKKFHRRTPDDWFLQVVTWN